MLFLRTSGETVEKVPKQILGGDPEKNDFTECATIDDLTLMKGRETLQNQALTELKGFSTVSEELYVVIIGSYFFFFTPSPVMGTKTTGMMSIVSIFPERLTIFFKSCM
jgi:hypothetical protein